MLNREHRDEIFCRKILLSCQRWEQRVGLIARKERQPDICKDADVAYHHECVLPSTDRVCLSAYWPSRSLLDLKDVRSHFKVDKK